MHGSAFRCQSDDDLDVYYVITNDVPYASNCVSDADM
jgi:hypothetical protein